MKINYTLFKRRCMCMLLLLVCQLNLAWAQNERKISGKVVDEQNLPLPGASVAVKGTSKAIATGPEGNFSITAKNGDVLVIKSIGYTAKEITVGSGNTYNVQLEQASNTLSDVVVVGYGTSTKKALVSSISSVKGDDLNKGAISDVGQMLQGKVPGLNISRSGDPNRNAAIIMRGASTLREGAQSPLFVIDGVPGADISLLAPDDIASIDVLKDAAAASIYGNRAANGVIMVTTKRGNVGQAQISLNTYFGVENVSNRYEMMDANQLRSFLAKNNSSLAPANDQGANTNWQNEVQRQDALSQNHNLSLSGGSEKTTYNASLNYFKQQGIVKTSGLDRFIGRLGIEQKALNDKLKLGITLSNSISDANLVPYRNTVLAQMLTYLPTSPVRNPDGSYFDNLIQTSYYNPVSMLENGKENLKTKNILGTFTANLKLPFGFSYDVSASYQNTQTVYGSFYNDIYTSRYNAVRNTPDPPASPSTISLVGANGLALRNAYQNTNKIVETYLTWSKKFGDHDITAVGGYSYQQSLNNDGLQTSSTNFPINQIGYNNLGLGNPYAIKDFVVNYGPGDYQEILLISDFARVNYNYKNKYLLQGSIRRDGSNVFGNNEKWGFFPSVGAGWNIEQENFMKSQNLVSALKLRGSYGIAGNSLGFAPLTTKLIYGSTGEFYYNGAPREFALGAVQNENPDLRWEKTATLNAGLDFGMFKGRLTGSVDWYNKRTTDLILTFGVDQNLYPYGDYTANVGKLSNKGVEIVLNGTPVSNANFTWTTGINLAHNVNKILTLSDDSRFNIEDRLMVTPDGAGQSGTSLQILRPGYPIGTFFTSKYAGKNAAGVSQYYDAAGNIKTVVENKTDYYILGNAQPKALIGWSNSVNYKNFDLSVFIRAVVGNKIMNVTRADLFRPNTAQFTNIPVEVENESTADFNSYKYSSRFLEDGSYLRLDNATLGYTFKKGLIPGIGKLRLYTTANNLFVITGYKGIDPEINQGGIAPGVDTNNFYPKTRTFLFGLNVSFN